MFTLKNFLSTKRPALLVGYRLPFACAAFRRDSRFYPEATSPITTALNTIQSAFTAGSLKPPSGSLGVITYIDRAKSTTNVLGGVRVVFQVWHQEG